MVEKPKLEDAPSKQAIIGRYVLTPRVFELLEETTPGAGGEIQLTDGIKALLKEEKVFGYTFEGKRFDAGDKFGMLQATVEFALKRPEFGDKFREYLKGLAALRSAVKWSSVAEVLDRLTPRLHALPLDVAADRRALICQQALALQAPHRLRHADPRRSRESRCRDGCNRIARDRRASMSQSKRKKSGVHAAL